MHFFYFDNDHPSLLVDERDGDKADAIARAYYEDGAKPTRRTRVPGGVFVAEVIFTPLEDLDDGDGEDVDPLDLDPEDVEAGDVVELELHPHVRDALRLLEDNGGEDEPREIGPRVVCGAQAVTAETGKLVACTLEHLHAGGHESWGFQW